LGEQLRRVCIEEQEIKAKRGWDKRRKVLLQNKEVKRDCICSGNGTVKVTFKVSSI
jgi:hypothetical protein